MSCVSVLAGLFAVILPETNKKPTREAFEDILPNFEERNVITPVNSDEEALLHHSKLLDDTSDLS